MLAWYISIYLLLIYITFRPLTFNIIVDIICIDIFYLLLFSTCWSCSLFQFSYSNHFLHFVFLIDHFIWFHSLFSVSVTYHLKCVLVTAVEITIYLYNYCKYTFKEHYITSWIVPYYEIILIPPSNTFIFLSFILLVCKYIRLLFTYSFIYSFILKKVFC